jgi:hypothetical protein
MVYIIFLMALGGVAFFKSWYMALNKACEGADRLADDAHEPVLQIYKKQNRELSYASERGGQAGLVKIKLADD